MHAICMSMWSCDLPPPDSCRYVTIPGLLWTSLRLPSQGGWCLPSRKLKREVRMCMCETVWQLLHGMCCMATAAWHVLHGNCCMATAAWHVHAWKLHGNCCMACACMETAWQLVTGCACMCSCRETSGGGGSWTSLERCHCTEKVTSLEVFL